jgi:hypothetical protein
MFWVEVGIIWMVVSVAGCLFFGRFVEAGKGKDHEIR